MQDHLDTVRTRYARIGAGQARSCCGDDGCAVGDAGATATVEPETDRLGYSSAQIDSLPEGAQLSLGCGNPLTIARLRPGESVLDLGSGGGIDCFLAAGQVGPRGRVIGVDMTPEMIARARRAAEAESRSNVEFRLGEIEHLPLADQSVDVVLSNCVVNLSPDKARVFREAFRVLRPGGRVAIMDILATAPLPDSIRNDPDLLGACIAGAATIDQTRRLLEDAGFAEIEIDPNEASRSVIEGWIPGSNLEAAIVSCAITARRPEPRPGAGRLE